MYSIKGVLTLVKRKCAFGTIVNCKGQAAKAILPRIK
jgi:hypothetical protein